MPELPEVEAMTAFLRGRITGSVVAKVYVTNVSVLKTFDPPIDALGGQTVTSIARHGKFVDINCESDQQRLHLIIHLAKAGWLRWSDSMSTTPPKPGRGPLAMRVRFDDGSGFDLTEAGTKKRLATYVVRDPKDVPGVARLGIDPLSEAFTPQALGALLTASGRAQIKGVLRDQAKIAGIGNAYSDEVLHGAKLSPYHPANRLADADVVRLHGVIRDDLSSAIERAAGLEARELKDSKRSSMRVHGRTGDACPVCGDVVREVSFADSSLQYCATCQTGGKVLADRRMSRLLK